MSEDQQKQALERIKVEVVEKRFVIGIITDILHPKLIIS
jgi:hypothetical protein